MEGNTMQDLDRPSVAPGNTFVVRIWLEWSKTGPCWRGQIVHAQSGGKMGFLCLEDMLRFMRGYVKMSKKGESREFK
jgi:hypothetical protein